MYVLFTDEANLDASAAADFFVCGGAFFPVDRFPAIHKGIAAIRERSGYKPDDRFKFNSRSKPDSVSSADFTAAKNEVYELAQAEGVQFIGYAIQHAIARNQTPEDIHYWGLHALLSHFHLFLEANAEYGVFVCDRLPFRRPFDVLEEIFQHGGRSVEGHRPRRPFDRVCALATTTINASHASSLADILLGGFRFCVNERDKDRVCSLLFPKLHRMMWGEGTGGGKRVLGKGLILRPEEIIAARYQRIQEELLEDFGRFLGSPIK